jgi:hypothetical protein
MPGLFAVGWGIGSISKAVGYGFARVAQFVNGFFIGKVATGPFEDHA